MHHSLKSDVEKRDIDKLKNVPSGLNSWKSKVDNLDVDKLKTVSIVLKKSSEVDKTVLRKSKYNADK